jgi:hypothetical protein
MTVLLPKDGNSLRTRLCIQPLSTAKYTRLYIRMIAGSEARLLLASYRGNHDLERSACSDSSVRA